MKTLFKTAIALITLAAAAGANAGILKINADAFTPAAGLITFSEQSLGTVNPVYNPADYGGGAGAPVVSFGGYFTGQSLGDATTCPADAALSGCVIGTPTGSLSLSADSPMTRIVEDGANPTSPVLSGSPIFNGSVAVLFDVDLAGVGLDGGFFDALGGTAITAFRRDGSVIGSVSNTSLAIEFLGLVTDDGTAQIAGLLFSLVGAEPAGFAIDNLRFGTAGQVNPPGEVPEPASLALLGLAMAGAAFARKRKA